MLNRNVFEIKYLTYADQERVSLLIDSPLPIIEMWGSPLPLSTPGVPLINEQNSHSFGSIHWETNGDTEIKLIFVVFLNMFQRLMF